MLGGNPAPWCTACALTDLALQPRRNTVAASGARKWPNHSAPSWN